MATAKWSAKDPQDIRDYWIDFTSLLAADGTETITAHTVTITATQHPVTAPFEDLAKVNDSLDVTNKWIRVRVSGGTPEKYAIKYHVTTNAGQEFDLTKTLTVKERTA